MRLIFATRPGLGSWLIRFFTGSQWSHVAIRDDDTVIEAVAGDGVRRRGLESFLAAWPITRVVDVAAPDDAAGLVFARQQIGKPYDGGAWWGFLLPWRDWQDPAAWFCSELAAAALQDAGLTMLADESRISPQALVVIIDAGPKPRPPR
jgi:uncharacterized protein YycO